MFQIRGLIYKCLEPNPSDRPDISNIYGIALGMTANADGSLSFR